MGEKRGGLLGPWHVGRHSITVSTCGPRKKGMAYRCRPTGGRARCGVDLNRPFVQRYIMSPELTAYESGTYGTSAHPPDGSRTCKPGTSVWARKVMKLASVCGAMPNWFASAATGG